MSLRLQSTQMAEKLKRLREREEERERRREEREEEEDRRRQERRQHERRQQGTLGVGSSAHPHYTHTPTPMPAPTPIVPIVPLPSSPVDDTIDEFDLVEEFFTFVIERTKNLLRRNEYEHAKDVAIARFWTLEDLKAMESPSSELYRMATSVECGIPDGIVRSFRRYMKAFKVWFRERAKQQAAGALIDIQYGPGGFIRGG
jgi:hypothetical protein